MKSPHTEPQCKAAQLPLLASATAVFKCGSITCDCDDTQRHSRTCAQQLTARERTGLLPHVVSSISAFLDVAFAPQWTILSACEHGFLTMLPRLASREPVNMNKHYRAYLFSKGLVAAATRGDLSIVQWLCCVYCPDAFAWRGLEAAAAAGQLAVLQWLTLQYPSYMQYDPPLLDLAARNGHIAVLQWLGDRFPDARASTAAVYTAISNCDDDVLAWLHRHCNAAVRSAGLNFAIRYGTLAIAKPFGDRLIGRVGCLDAWAAAAESSDLSIVQWVYDVAGPPPLTATTLMRAMHAGHLDVMRWLHETLAPSLLNVPAGNFGERSMDKAAGRGDMETLLWLHAHYPTECSSIAINNAAEHGHLDIVQWLHEHRTDGCTTNAMDGAARNGHVDILEWLYVNRQEGCSLSAVRTAAAFGHLEVLQWFHAHGIGGFGTSVMDVAATYGHLEIVQWLHEHRTEGCTTRAMNGAAERNHLDVVEWLHENRSEGCTTTAMDLAAARNRLEIVQWLHENRTEGCTTEAMDNAGSLEMVQWLHTHRTEGCTTDAMSNAVARGDMALVLWLYDHRTEGCEPEAVDIAADRRHAELFQWLHDTYPDTFQASAVVDNELGGEFLEALMHHMALA